VNGTEIARPDRVVGTFRRFAFDITDAIRPGTNAIAIEVEPVAPKKDLTITWIDWNPMPCPITAWVCGSRCGSPGRGR
jgi:exo-1,4-beta-D-glucosaminidase